MDTIDLLDEARSYTRTLESLLKEFRSKDIIRLKDALGNGSWSTVLVFVSLSGINLASAAKMSGGILWHVYRI